ncbi:MAG: sulfate transporter, ATPase subunit, partial [Ilumatobacteraceae bacterium]|nr:sulfate transporter, ATPase subunit [Ilumatobacteraceae bacterium]
GPVTRLDGQLVRPHDVEMHTTERPGAHLGEVTRITRVGFEVRVDVAVGDESVLVTLTRTHFQALGLQAGDTVWLLRTAGAPTVVTGWNPSLGDRRRQAAEAAAQADAVHDAADVDADVNVS